VGIFSPKPKAERETFGQAMARAKATNDERRQAGDERIARAKHQDELLKAATDPATTAADRDAATTALVELIGQAKADKLIGARSRLVRRGWIR
jgi:hypothetical protein